MAVIVLQSHRSRQEQTWIGRCIRSVERWAAIRGHDYEFVGDELFDLCGPDYLAQVRHADVRAITNLARLELIRRKLAEGYDRAIWIDADVFIFAPHQLKLEIAMRYAFARETWIWARDDGALIPVAGVNNCVCGFARGEPDLDLLIHLTRHVAAHRQIRDNYQVGGDILKGLRVVLDFAMFDNIGMFSPKVLGAIADSQADILRLQAQSFGSEFYAANLCITHDGNLLPRAEALMDRLESSGGAVINQYLRTSGSA